MSASTGSTTAVLRRSPCAALAATAAGGAAALALKSYFDANPDAAKDLQTIQQPPTSLSTRCKLPVSLPQLLGLLQSAQAGGLPDTGPGLLPGVTTAQQVAGTQTPLAGGPLPGPTSLSTR